MQRNRQCVAEVVGEALGLPHPDVIIDNDGALSLAIDRFVEVVRQAVEASAGSAPGFQPAR